MKVLELPSWYLPKGGQFVRHQALALQEHGIDVSILANVTIPWREYLANTFNAHFPYRPFFTIEDGIPILRNYFRPIPKCEITTIRLWAKRTLSLYKMYVSRYGHPDIMHVHSSTWGAYAASLIKHKYGTPYVVTEHRGVYSYKCQFARDAFKDEYTPFLQEGLSNADYIISVGELLIDKLRSYLTRDVPIRVVSNIVDTDFFVPDIQKRPHEPFRWISVNGYRFVKAYDILLPAFDSLCNQRDDATLVIVGEDFEQPSFHPLLESCRHKDRIRFTGELDRIGVLRELQQADALVISSRVEAQSVSVLEALSCGLPVVGTEVIPPYTLPEHLGIRVPVEQPNVLTEAMSTVMHAYASYSPRAARTHALAIAHKDIVAKQLIDIYNYVLAN